MRVQNGQRVDVLGQNPKHLRHARRRRERLDGIEPLRQVVHHIAHRRLRIRIKRARNPHHLFKHGLHLRKSRLEPRISQRG